MNPPPSPADPSISSGDPRGAWRIFAVPGILALVGYVAFYACDARLRTRQGPWEVTFGRTGSGTPTLTIDQPHLGIEGVLIRFAGESVPTNTAALPVRVRFEDPHQPVPFGKTAFDDLMYLPGTVVLHCFGHEVQLVPRQLYLNRAGVAWENGKAHELEAGSKLPTLEPPPKLPRTPAPGTPAPRPAP